MSGSITDIPVQEPPMSTHYFGRYDITNLCPLTNPRAINNFGQVVGYTSAQSPQAILWQPHARMAATGTAHSLDTLAGAAYAAYALGINDEGQIMGYSVDGNGDPQVVLWSPTGPNTPDLGSPCSLSFPVLVGSQFGPPAIYGGINDAGLVASNAGRDSHAALYTPGAPPPNPIEFDNLGFYYVAAIN